MGTYAKAGKQVATSCQPSDMQLNNSNLENGNYGEIADFLRVSEVKGGSVPHKFEYQEVCQELEKIYGKLIWTLPHKMGFTEYKIRKAHEICQKKEITSIKYLIGVIKRL